MAYDHCYIIYFLTESSVDGNVVNAFSIQKSPQDTGKLKKLRKMRFRLSMKKKKSVRKSSLVRSVANNLLLRPI